MKKIIFGAVAVVLITLFLVTCDDLLFPQGAEDVDYLDWQYEEYPDGGGKLTLMLDGSTPFAHAKLNQRALNAEMAKMAHDYFEVIFVNGSLTTDSNNNVSAASTVARASWEIGQPAGISGVPRGTAGINYGPVYPSSDGPASVIFVGKKTGKTLLGIGHLIQVNEGTTVLTATPTLITPAATAVTFGVYPLKTNVGWYDDNGDSTVEPPVPVPTPEVLRGFSTFNATEIARYADVTFQTATEQKSITGDLTIPTPTKTLGSNITLRGGLRFPLYTLPDAVKDRTIEAYYIISGMASATATEAEYGTIAKPALLESARIIGTLMVPSTNSLGIEIIKRTPSYITGGQTLDAAGVIDTYTKVEPLSHLFTDAGKAFNYDDATYTGINGTVIKMQFTQRKDADGESSGIFAITFQCPVYAITQANATNNGPGAEKWYIRPGYQQYQYLLDNGKDAGGMVMLGTNAGDVDWLEIWTVGIGFSN